jgi:hypothetical protein
MIHFKHLVPIPLLLSLWFNGGCVHPPAVVPEFNLEAERSVVASVGIGVSREVDVILDAVDSGRDQAPDLGEWPIITSSASRIGVETDRLAGLEESLETKDSLILSLSESAEVLKRDKAELVQELEDARKADLNKSFGLMILAGSAALAAGVALAIFVSAKIGASVALIGLCWVALGRFLSQWAWVMDVALLVLLVGLVLYLVVRYKGIFVDFVTSVRDTLDGDEDKRKAIEEKSTGATVKEAQKAMQKK